METQSLAKPEMSALQGMEQAEVIQLPEQVNNPEESNIRTVIIIRWLSVLFCLAFWYGVYKLIAFFIS